MRASERLAWAADVVAPSPSDRILEVGCGHGVLVSLLAERLTAGVVVGIDRSATMVATAARRNASEIDAGKVRLEASTLTGTDLDGQVFDVVVSFDVRAFWTPPAPEWDVVERVLAPAGRVLVAFSLMTPVALEPVTTAIRQLAGERGLEPTAVERAATSPYGSVAVILHRTGA